MLDSTTKSLNELGFASLMRKSFITRERRIVDVFATICWFQELRINLNVTTVVAVQRAIEPTSKDKAVAVSRRWIDYKNGRHTPSAQVIVQVQRIFPSTSLVLQSHVWDALRIHRSAEQVARSLIGTTSNLGDELLRWMLAVHANKDYDSRWLKKRCIDMLKQGSLEGLAVLTICMRLAANLGIDRLAVTFSKYAGYCLLILGLWFFEHGIAQGIGEYFEFALIPEYCKDHWTGNFSAAHYIHSILCIDKMIGHAMVSKGGNLSSDEMIEAILKILEL